MKIEIDDKISKATKLLIDVYSRWLSLADYYDAITTRKNNKFNNEKIDFKSVIIANNLDQTHLINGLYKMKIFI